MNFCTSEEKDVLAEIGSRDSGLTEQEAADRLARNGKNQLEAAKKVPLIVRFLEQLQDPMIIILLVAALISGVMSVIRHEGFADVIIILFVVMANAVLGVFQEGKAEKAIEALQKMSAATSRVLRGGEIRQVRSEDLVVGDVIMLEAGDAVPADARILSSASLRIEEAALTGESVAVEKTSDALQAAEGHDIPLGDRRNMVYMGSTVAYGRGKAVVTAAGMDTEMGKIAGALKMAEDGKTPLQIKMAQLSKVLTWLVLGICAVVLAVQLIRGGNIDFAKVMDSLMVAVSLAVAAIPEGLAAVVTVVLSIGVTNMSKRNAIIRRLTAVETLGCAQIVCSDKTGTLTQNKMTVVESFGGNDALAQEAMALCNDAGIDDKGEVIGEPTEAALVAWAKKKGLDKRDIIKGKERCGEIPFDSGRKMMTTLHWTKDGIVQYTKGAPDIVLARCTAILRDGVAVPMTDEDRTQILSANKAMADKALRVLACARRQWKDMPNTSDAASVESGMCFVGLTGMIDPVRPEVKAAIAECREAGITPIMITGDHVDTAVAIAKELGIWTEEGCATTGAALDKMDDAEFESRFRSLRVYARVQPEHKTRIVNAWRRDGRVTAMTGDGVNDAPSIKSADIGIGMGITGTDVTKNVADMILADDNFATIVGAVEEGRRIYDNIRKAIQFLLSSNMSEVFTIFFATLIGFTILKPVHLLWINLVTDCFPALAIGMEQAEDDIMKRKPRDPKEGVFAGGMGVDVILQGLLVCAVTLASYFVGVKLETGSFAIATCGTGTTMAFITMSLAEIFHSINMRSRLESIFTIKRKNAFLYIAGAVSLAATTVVCQLPLMARLFSFTTVSWCAYAISLALALLVIPVVEGAKALRRRAAGKKR